MAIVEKRISRDGEISYRAKVRIKGFAPQTATFKRKTDADRWGKAKESAMMEGRYFPEAKAKNNTIDNLIEAYLKDLEVKNPRRAKEVRKLLSWWQQEFGSTILSDFNSEHVLSAQQLLRQKKTAKKDNNGNYLKLGNATINRYTVAINTVFNFGIRRLKWIKHNPVMDVDKFKEPNGRTRFLSLNEIERLFDACRNSQNPYLFAIVLVAITTGARKGEIERMRWQDVSDNGKRITLWKTKNGEIRTAHLSGPAYEIVKKLEKTKGNAIMLFPSLENSEKSIDFRHAWEHALKIAEIENFHFHDLRHTCASYLAMNGANVVEMAEALGHKTLAMVRRYAHLSESHVSKITEAMTENVFKGVKI